MKKLLWLALLLPMSAWANPYTVEYCEANPTNDICVGFNLDRDRLDTLEAMAGSGGDEIGPMPADCLGATWPLIVDGTTVSSVYPDGKYIMEPANDTRWPLRNLVKVFRANTSLMVNIQSPPSQVVSFVAASGFADSNQVSRCIQGLIDSNRL